MRRIFRHRLLNGLIKLTIVLLLAWSLYRQVFRGGDPLALWRLFQENWQSGRCLWLLAVIGMAPLNWGLETRKWQVLVGRFVRLGFWRSYAAVLAGVTVSLFTPNRIGEYGGRILLVNARYNWQAVLATLVGSFSQILSLLTFGWLGFWQLLSGRWQVQPDWMAVLGPLGLIVLGLLWWGYFNLHRWIAWFDRRRWPARWYRAWRWLRLLGRYRRKELAGAALFSFLRYLTYVCQYLFLLWFFEVEVPWLPGLGGIAAIYFAQTSVPLPPLIGLLTRGQMALLVWTPFSGSELSLLAVPFGLFVINLAVPALLGMAIIVQTNVIKSLGYENGAQSS